MAATSKLTSSPSSTSQSSQEDLEPPKSNYKLLLASKSNSRHKLLSEARISITPIDSHFDESLVSLASGLRSAVEELARRKMNSVVMPSAVEGQVAFVITADTLTQNADGKIEGKPKDKEDAIRMIRNARDGSTVGSAFCLHKKRYVHGQWEIVDQRTGYGEATCTFLVPDRWLNFYLQNSIAYRASCAISVEELGGIFLKSVSGCYTAILGLPMHELFTSLEKMGFFCSSDGTAP